MRIRSTSRLRGGFSPMTTKGDFSKRTALFNVRHVKCPVSGCWLWTGAKDKDGYGRVSWPPFRFVHRWAHTHFIGPIPLGLFVLHRCDTPACVNPAHLFIGDADANNKDAARKNRTAKGAKHPMAKMTDASAAEMRSLRANEGLTLRQLARRFTVSETLVHQVLSGQRWL